ncbi:MAG TPA: alpha/beta fold hydrolase [Polyangiales bacterium]|nr:alpha/beta fold hydrolase [Polyangiales bacterium]
MTVEDWTFGGTWPYAPRWFESPDGKMHYVDEGPGDGKPVVMVHGNPTWAYLYRNFIPSLVEAGYRCIVPDHLGFGRSDKPDDAELYQVPRHAERLDALLESLDLREATLVCQDWGGPIGFHWATRHPDRIGALCVLNTMAHRPRGKVTLPLPLRLFRTPGVGEIMVKGAHMFVRGFLFNAGIVHKGRITPQLRAAYLAPHPTYSSRTSILVFPREIPADSTGRVAEFLGRVEEGLIRLQDKPTMIAWAMKDIAFLPEYLDQLWLKDFPDADVLRIPDAGHYLQEDAYERIVPKLVAHLHSVFGRTEASAGD